MGFAPPLLDDAPPPPDVNGDAASRFEELAMLGQLPMQTAKGSERRGQNVISNMHAEWQRIIRIYQTCMLNGKGSSEYIKYDIFCAGAERVSCAAPRAAAAAAAAAVRGYDFQVISAGRRLKDHAGGDVRCGGGIEGREDISRHLKISQDISQDISRHLKRSQDISRHRKTSQDISRHLKTSQDISRHLKTSQDIARHLKNVAREPVTPREVLAEDAVRLLLRHQPRAGNEL
eukprot:SAG31_NODE_13076_length_894_cov_1.773585_1_plen_231_part_10